MKLTPWFDGMQKPARIGIYQVRRMGTIGYSWFDGKRWSYLERFKCDALAGRLLTSGAAQNKEWRGLAEKQE